MTFHIVAKDATHDDALLAAWLEHFGGPTVVSRGRQFDGRKLPGFVAVEDGKLLGALTWHAADGEIEVVSLNSFVEKRGVGTALLAAAVDLAKAIGARRLWLVTTNDNTQAIRFYQRRGWDLRALHFDSVKEARKIKPAIPLIGDDGIAIRHEIEIEYRLIPAAG